MPDQAIYIWIEEAATHYHRSRAYLDELIKAGKLTYAKFQGDRRVYLHKSELDAMFGKPMEEGRRGESAS